jgi:hypothetical protein
VHLLPLAGSITDWMEKYHGTLVGQYTFPKMPGKNDSSVNLYVVRLN